MRSPITPIGISTFLKLEVFLYHLRLFGTKFKLLTSFLKRKLRIVMGKKLTLLTRITLTYLLHFRHLVQFADNRWRCCMFESVITILLIFDALSILISFHCNLLSYQKGEVIFIFDTLKNKVVTFTYLYLKEEN